VEKTSASRDWRAVAPFNVSRPNPASAGLQDFTENGSGAPAGAQTASLHAKDAGRARIFWRRAHFLTLVATTAANGRATRRRPETPLASHYRGVGRAAI
jgi:hypothetical protein